MMKKTGPDSCHSWVVAAGCCFINTMLFGMARLSGVLFVASMSAFHVAREEASFPFTLAAAVRNTSGPLVGYLGHKLGVRLVTSCGCVLGALGISMCFLAKDIATVTVLWGAIFGLGYGMGNVLLPVAINQHFDKKRATASGISFSGACIGSFIMPPIVEYLINTYGLSGTFLVLAGFVFNCLPAALLLSKPNFITNENSEKQSITQGTKFDLYTVEKIVIENKNHCLNNKNGGCKNNRTVSDDINVEYCNECKNAIVCQANNRRNSSNESVKILSANKLNDEKFSKSYDEVYLNQGYQYDCEEDSKSYQKEQSRTSKATEKKSALSSFSIIFDPIFILIALTMSLYTFMFVCMMTIIVDFARDIGVNAWEEKYILMSLSVGDLIGRLGFGWVTDDGYMTRANFAALCFFFQGLSTTIMTWSNGFPMLVTMAGLYGLSEAGFILINPLLIAEYIEKDKQTVAIPTSNFLSGPLCLALAPMIGFFRDDIGSYDFIFYGMGVISFLCTLVYLFTPYIDRCRRK